MTVRERVQAVFADVFDDPEFELRDEMTAADVPDWDSLNHINLIVGIETEFGIQLDGEQIAALANVGDLFRLLAQHGVSDDGA
jgi:acyl carrier protein